MRVLQLLMVWCLLGSVALLGQAEPPKDEKKPEPAKPEPAKKKFPANPLAKESSPYLLQHAHNPVHWHPWGSAAFEKAKKENKLIFLSIGYSSCHWCHVMERESFSNEDIAKVMNEHFVCIKVDREERPDIDQIYMTALHALGQGGGWPLSMFLTSEGKPIFGGTYWPPLDKEVQGEKVRGFKSVLTIVQEIHKKEPKQIADQADKLANETNQALAGRVLGIALVELKRDLVSSTCEELKEQFDKTHGGFGSPTRGFRGPKFPIPSNVGLLQREAYRLAKSEPKQAEELAEIVHFTLDKMSQGGIYDQLGGGFHRYSTERTWTVPHFEKMLYDNAQLVELYARAYAQTKKPSYKRVVQETLAFIGREMTSPEGGFYSALDADSEEEEGKFYVWQKKELSEQLDKVEDAKLLQEVYGLTGQPNFEGKYLIPTLAQTWAEKAASLKLTEEQLLAKLAPGREKLFAARAKRERPFLDTKVLTSWTGEMIAGYALAGQVLAEPKYLATAAKAADFVLSKLKTKEGRLLRTYGAAPGEKPQAKLNAYLDDYAYLVHGLLTLHDATKEKKWLDEAIALTDTMLKLFHDEKAGGFFYTSNDHEKLFARAKDQFDGAQPSGNSVATRNLARLWQKTGEPKYQQLTEKSIKAFGVVLRTNASGMPSLSEALSIYLDVQESQKK